MRWTSPLVSSTREVFLASHHCPPGGACTMGQRWKQKETGDKWDIAKTWSLSW